MTENGKKHQIDWHSGFAGGLGLSLREYRDDIVIEREYPLSKEPLKIDFIVIKKKSGIVIDNDLGRLFRKFNLIEFKSPDDELSIDVLWKCIGYAGLYKGFSERVDQIPVSELTVTILRYSRPQKLFAKLESDGLEVKKVADGVYEICGVVSLPLCVVIIRELSDAGLLSLKIMTKNADENEVRSFLMQTREFSVPGDRHDADAVLQVSSSANKELYDRLRRENAMCQALKEILSEEIAEERAEGRAEGRVEGRIEGEELLASLLKKLFTSVIY